MHYLSTELIKKNVYFEPRMREWKKRVNERKKRDQSQNV